jgi:hypothetical protein
MKELTAMEEFAFNSDRIKTAMLEELLRERSILQNENLRLTEELGATRRMRDEYANKLAVANSVIGRLTSKQ